MKMLLKTLMIVSGGLLIVEVIALVFMANFNLGWVLTLLMGSFLIIYGLFLDEINAAMSSGFLLALRYFGYALLLFLLGTVTFLGVYGNCDNVTYEEDAVIVLGAGLRGDRVSLTFAQRLDAAYDYWQENPDAFLVVTGGQGPGETIPEGEAGATYLLNKGLPREHILVENKSTSTRENFEGAKTLLDQQLGKDYDVAYATNSFHIYRAGCIAKEVGLEASHCHGAIAWYTIPVVYLREFAAVLAYWLT